MRIFIRRNETRVESEKGGKSYHVRYSSLLHRWVCTCPHFLYRLADENSGECKHIAAFHQFIDTASNEELQEVIDNGRR